MKKIKVSEAKGSILNWMVGTAMGFQTYLVDKYGVKLVEVADKDYFGVHMGQHWSPSVSWEQGGPIIERIKGFQFKQWLECKPDTCCEAHIHNYKGDWIQFGPTPLIAAMRCFVASKLGDEVEIPIELT